MVNEEDWMDIRTLHKEGHTISAIHRMTGLSRKTIRRTLGQTVPTRYRRVEPPGKLERFKEYARGRWEETALSGVRIFEEISKMGYQGSVQTLRRYLAGFRGDRRREARLTVRFETPPGKQAQADWAYCGKHKDSLGREIAVYAFVMKLSYSRMRFVRFTSSMTTRLLIESQMKAFEYFGGAPEAVLYDNMAQVRLAGGGGLNPLFADFARAFGFEIRTHRVRRPRTKGKVERDVHTVRGSFLNGREFSDFEDLNSQVRAWCDRTNGLVHGTTRRIPFEMLGEEKLRGLVPYRVVERTERRAGYDGFVAYRKSRYSVPPEAAGRAVIVEDDLNRITVRLGDMIVAEHTHSIKPGAEIAHPDHVKAMWRITLDLAARRSPVPNWRLTFRDEVEVRPLSTYEVSL